MATTFLEGDAVTLRTMDANEDEDVELVQRLFNHPSVWRSDSAVSPRPRNFSTSKKWLDNLASSDAILTKICVDGDPIGVAIIKDIDQMAGTANVGASLLPEYHGNGYGTEAVRIQTDFCFEQLGLRKVTYETTGQNDAAIELVDKLGGELEGVLREEAFVDGEYQDVHHYGVMAEEWEG